MILSLLIIPSIALSEPIYKAPCPSAGCVQQSVDFYGVTQEWRTQVYSAHNFAQFKNLHKVKLKDRVMVNGERYRVSDIREVSMYDMSILEVPEDTIRMMTCTSRDRYRLIVSAKRYEN